MAVTSRCPGARPPRPAAQVNNRPAFRLRGGQWEEIKWHDVAVGHVVRVDKGQEFPADIVTLSTSEDEGVAYVETSNLDGETNLKPKRALAETMNCTVQQLSKLVGTVEHECPNKVWHRAGGGGEERGGGPSDLASCSPASLPARGVSNALVY